MSAVPVATTLKLVLPVLLAPVAQIVELKGCEVMAGSEFTVTAKTAAELVPQLLPAVTLTLPDVAVVV